MKYNYVYKIINNINNNIYIGIHFGELDDKYMGSGILIKKAISKYGIDNFTKTILVIGESKTYVAEIESILVDTNFINRRDTYNICVGGGNPPSGSGCDNPFYGKTHKKESKLRMSNTHKGKHLSESTRKKMSQSTKGIKHPFYGKHRDKITIDKISKTLTNTSLCKQVCKIDKITGDILQIYKSARFAARECNLSNSSISKCCRGKGYKTVGGFIWKFYEKL